MADMYVPQDMFGFGRLANIEMEKRREDRLDKESDLRNKVAELQLAQTVSNIETAKRKEKLRDEISILVKQPPEGENSFTAAYKHMMANGAFEEADAWMKRQSDIVDNLMKRDRSAGTKLLNESILKATGMPPVTPHPNYKDIFEGTDPKTGRPAWLQVTDKGIEAVPNPGEYIPKQKETKEPYKTEYIQLLEERNKYKKGSKEWDDITKRINKLSSIKPDGSSGDVDGTIFNDQDIDFFAKQYIADKSSLPGRIDKNTRLRIMKRASQIAQSEGKSPEEILYSQEDRKSIQKSIASQEKQYGSMVSFVDNLEKQGERLKTISNKLYSLDPRIFNMPITAVRKRIIGDPNQAKFEMYLTEMESELGKLASGSTQSIAQLSEGARAKWEKILDKNMSVKNLLDLIDETKQAGRIRLDSVKTGLGESRKRLREIGNTKQSETKKPTRQEFIDAASKDPRNKGISSNDLGAYYDKKYGGM